MIIISDLEKIPIRSVMCLQVRILLLVVVALVEVVRVTVIFPWINEFHYFASSTGVFLFVCYLETVYN